MIFVIFYYKLGIKIAGLLAILTLIRYDKSSHRSAVYVFDQKSSTFRLLTCERSKSNAG